MDKIAGDWINTFGHIQHNTIYAGPRYTEIVSTADEPGLASAKARWIQVPGINASLVSITPEKQVKLCTARETACIQSAFILNGLANSQFNGRPITTRGSSHAFQYSPYVDEQHIIEGDSLEALHLEFDPAYFISLLLSAEEAIFEDIANSLERKEQFMVPPTQLPLHVSMSDIIRAIQHCTFHSFTRSLFIEAKLLELVALQMDYLSTLYAPAKTCISVTDREKLFSLKEYIEKHYLQPLSLKQLGRLSGLNEFKLKKGYRSLFHTTVFGHIHHLRMQQARQWLTQGDMTVTEVSARIGYSSSGNFSAAFKKQFGYPPTQVGQAR